MSRPLAPLHRGPAGLGATRWDSNCATNWKEHKHCRPLDHKGGKCSFSQQISLAASKKRTPSRLATDPQSRRAQQVAARAESWRREREAAGATGGGTPREANRPIARREVLISHLLWISAQPRATCLRWPAKVHSEQIWRLNFGFAETFRAASRTKRGKLVQNGPARPLVGLQQLGLAWPSRDGSAQIRPDPIGPGQARSDQTSPERAGTCCSCNRWDGREAQEIGSGKFEECCN